MVITLVEAIALVVAIMYLFMQNLRAALIPVRSPCRWYCSAPSACTAVFGCSIDA